VGHRKKYRRIEKYRKITLLSLFQEKRGQRKKIEKLQNKTENNTIKPLSTIFVPCMKIQDDLLPPAADTHDCNSPILKNINFYQKINMDSDKTPQQVMHYVTSTMI